MIMIHPGAEMRGGVRQDPSAPCRHLKLDRLRKALRDEERTYLAAGISPNVSSSGTARCGGNNNYPSSVSGVGTDYLDHPAAQRGDRGRCLPKPDIQYGSQGVRHR